jgi:hypothetical protein
LLEGGRQCPGDMLLVMSPSWIVKDKSDKGEGLHSLYVKKAIVFDRGGFSFIDVFRVPRKCTYFNYTVEHHNNHGCLRRPLLVVHLGLENSGSHPFSMFYSYPRLWCILLLSLPKFPINLQ